MRTRLWRRLEPGEVPVIDLFLMEQVDRVHEDLAHANEWHENRAYVLDPPLPRGSSRMMFHLDEVVLRTERRRGLERWMRGLGGVAIGLAVAQLIGSLLWPLANLFRI